VAASLLGLALAGPFMRSADAAAFCFLVLAVMGAGTVFGAHVMHRWRLQGFLAQARQREEGEIAAALYQAATALAPVEQDADVLEGLVQIAQRALGCDWACAARWDPRATVFRLASHRLPADIVSEVRHLDFGPDFACGRDGVCWQATECLICMAAGRCRRCSALGRLVAAGAAHAAASKSGRVGHGYRRRRRS
jgi:hypothetical protein